MNKFLFFLFAISSFESSAQKQNAIWCFGDSAGIDFRNTSAPVPFYSAMDSRGSCVSIADSNGNLLFYAATYAIESGDFTTKVFNRNNLQMLNGNSIIGEGWYKELVIIPDPKNNNQYYLFCAGVVPEDSGGGIYYSIIDMNQNGGLGAVTQKNIPLDTIEQVDGIAAIKHGNGRDCWVINKQSDQLNNTFETYLVTTLGVSGPFFQSIGPSTYTNSWEHRFSPDGSKMMVIDFTGLLALYDFDRCTGLLSNPTIIFPENSGLNLWDGEFSANGNIFYVTSEYDDTNYTKSYLFQLDLTSSHIASTLDTIGTFTTPVIAGALARGPDDKIYLSCWYDCNAFPICYPYPDSVYNSYSMNLSVINNPDILGSACNFTSFGFYLGGKRTYIGLPNNPNYELGPLVGSPCDTLNAMRELTNEGVQLTIYPNPANVVLQVMVKGANNRIKGVAVRDVLGKEVMNKQSENLSAYFNINVSALSGGVYMLEAITEKGGGITKFVKVANGN